MLPSADAEVEEAPAQYLLTGQYKLKSSFEDWPESFSPPLRLQLPGGGPQLFGGGYPSQVYREVSEDFDPRNESNVHSLSCNNCHLNQGQHNSKQVEVNR